MGVLGTFNPEVTRSMQTKVSTLVIAAVLFASSAISAPAQSASPGGGFTVTIPASSKANPGDAGVRAHTNIRTLATADQLSGTPAVSGPPFPGLFYEDPASIACLYSLAQPTPGCNPYAVSHNPTGGGRAIAIVDAYDDPNATTDLEGFAVQFGLNPVTSSNFSVVYAPAGGSSPGSCSGPATKPPVDPTGGWEVEESLDIEWAYAMAPRAKVYLVEAQSNSLLDLFCGATVASGLVEAAGGGEVSMSWGSGEFPQETLLDFLFTTPKVVYFAAAGDSPGPIWPSTSPNVVSAGGTTISRNPVTGNFELENVWQDAGGGPSAIEARPAYQNAILGITGPSRGTPDMATDSNPNTGVWVLDNFMPPSGCYPCWYIVGGTSVASPTLAGIVNSAGNFSASSTVELTNLYKLSSFYFNDITLGSCGLYLGYFAAPGWDFCTGLGSPHNAFGK